MVPPPGVVAALSGPGTDAPNTMSDVMYLKSVGGNSGNGNNYFSNWCSGVYAPSDGVYGSMVFSNGGDADYWGNEVYKFAFDTRRWSRECSRSTDLNGITTTGGDPNFDEVWGEHRTPGGAVPPQPGVPHSYDQMEYLPPHLGGGPRGSFMFPTRTIVYRYRRYKHPHVFDLDAKAWRRGAATPGIVGWGSAADAPTWCFDSRRNRFWGLEGGSTGLHNHAIRYLDFDPQTGLAISGGIAIPTFLSPNGCPVSRYWPVGDLMLVAGTSSGVFTIYGGSLVTVGRTGFSALILSGTTVPAAEGYGLAYCDDLDCFFVRTASGHRQKIWKLIPPKLNYLAQAWVVEEITMGGRTVSAKDNPQGMWKRFMYAPTLKCLVWVDDRSGPVYAYRPVGT